MGADDILSEKFVSDQCPSQDRAVTDAPDGLTGRKANLVVAAALRLITEQSFQNASMEAIAREAGVSKATLYAYFPSKNKLFEHIINAECRKIRASLIMPDLDHGLAEALWLFAKQYVRLFVDRDPRRMAFFHALFREAAQFPELAQRMVESGPRADAGRLAGLMEEARRRNLLDIEDPNLAARQFLCLIRGDLPIENLLALPAPSDAEVSETIEEGLAFFLRAYQRRAPRGESGAPIG